MEKKEYHHPQRNNATLQHNKKSYKPAANSIEQLLPCQSQTLAAVKSSKQPRSSPEAPFGKKKSSIQTTDTRIAEHTGRGSLFLSGASLTPGTTELPRGRVLGERAQDVRAAPVFIKNMRLE